MRLDLLIGISPHLRRLEKVRPQAFSGGRYRSTKSKSPYLDIGPRRSLHSKRLGTFTSLWKRYNDLPKQSGARRS